MELLSFKSEISDLYRLQDPYENVKLQLQSDFSDANDI